MDNSGFWQSSGTYEQSFISLRVQRLGALLLKSVKKSGQKLVTSVRGCELLPGRYDVAASFKLLRERWNDLYQSAPEKTQILNSRTEHVQAVFKLLNFLRVLKCAHVFPAHSESLSTNTN
jgi:hypothetical protein